MELKDFKKIKSCLKYTKGSVEKTVKKTGWSTTTVGIVKRSRSLKGYNEIRNG